MSVEALEEENRKLKEENEVLKSENNLLKEQFQALKDSNAEVLKRLTALEQQSNQQKAPPSPDSNVARSRSNPVMQASQSSDDIAGIKRDVFAANASITDIQNGWSKATVRLDDHEEKLHHQHQYSCLNSLKIIGLLDIPSKTYGLAFSEYVLKKLKSFFPNIADKLRIEDIDTSHPMSSARDKKSCVIVKWNRRDIRNLVFFEKRELKKQPNKVIIVEHLSPTNLWYLNEARKCVGFHNVWSSQCVVYALVNKKKVAVKCYRDLMYVYNNYSNRNHNFNMSYANAASTDNREKPSDDSTLASSSSPSPEGSGSTEGASKANTVVLAENNPVAEAVTT